MILRDRLGLEIAISESESDDYLLECAGKKLVMNNVLLSRQVETGALSAAMPSLPLDRWDVDDTGLSESLVSKSIPILFGRPGFTVDTDGNGRLELDVLGSAFFMLSRLEEVVLSERDAHDRFPATASIAYRGGFLDRPIVDEYVEILWSAIKTIWPTAQRSRSEFSIAVSHDIDSPSYFAFTPWKILLRRAAGDWLKRGHLRQPVYELRMRLQSRRRIHPADPYNTFHWIMDYSERMGLTSTFYVVCGRNHPEFDPEYDVGHPAIRQLLRDIRDRQHSIGLHASYDTYKSAERVAAEADRLKEVCAEEGIELPELCCRMHYLRWQTPTTVRYLHSAGISVDSTLSFADCAGFRCGTCHEYPAFDPVAGERLDVSIRPLVVMDGTIMDERYMGLGVTEAAAEAMLALKNACRTVGGVFSLLWHNTQLVSEEQRSLYGSVLAG